MASQQCIGVILLLHMLSLDQAPGDDEPGFPVSGKLRIIKQVDQILTPGTNNK